MDTACLSWLTSRCSPLSLHDRCSSAPHKALNSQGHRESPHTYTAPILPPLGDRLCLQWELVWQVSGPWFLMAYHSLGRRSWCQVSSAVWVQLVASMRAPRNLEDFYSYCQSLLHLEWQILYKLVHLKVISVLLQLKGVCLVPFHSHHKFLKALYQGTFVVFRPKLYRNPSF